MEHFDFGITTNQTPRDVIDELTSLIRDESVGPRALSALKRARDAITEQRAALSPEAFAKRDEIVRANALEEAAQLMIGQAQKWEKEASKHLPHWNSATGGHAASDFARRDLCLKHVSIIRGLQTNPSR